MAGVYTSVFQNIATTGVQDLFWVEAPTDSVVEILDCTITNRTSETSEQLAIVIQRTTTNNAAQGTPNTPRPHMSGYAAFGGTVRTNVLTTAASTASEVLRSEGFNVLNGYGYLPVPEARIYVNPGGRLAIRLDVTPSTNPFDGTFTFREIGG